MAVGLSCGMTPGKADTRQKRTSSPAPQVALRFDRIAVQMRCSARMPGFLLLARIRGAGIGPPDPTRPAGAASDGIRIMAMAIGRSLSADRAGRSRYQPRGWPAGPPR